MGTSPPLSRRLLLQGAALTGACGVLSGCGSNGEGTAGPSAAPLDGDAGGAAASTASGRDIRIVRAAIDDERVLLADFAAAATAVPRLAKALAPVADQQRQHVAALRAALIVPDRVHATRSRPAHGDGSAVLRGLRRSLVVAQHRRRADALAAHTGLLARLLASMSASHAVAAGLDSLRP